VITHCREEFGFNSSFKRAESNCTFSDKFVTYLLVDKIMVVLFIVPGWFYSGSYFLTRQMLKKNNSVQFHCDTPSI